MSGPELKYSFSGPELEQDTIFTHGCTNVLETLSGPLSSPWYLVNIHLNIFFVCHFLAELGWVYTVQYECTLYSISLHTRAGLCSGDEKPMSEILD